MQKGGHSITLTPAVAGAATTAESDGPSEYRDRAAERRQAFGTSKKTSLPMKKSSAANENGKDSPTDTVAEEAGKSANKGMALLGKMGWSAGEGLGAQGTGRTETIATDMYVAGVGLGAQGGKVGDAAEEAERNTKGGYKEFAERTKEKARERFGGLNG